MAIKSLVTGVRVDVALHAHNCQANERHRIQKGEVRLKVRQGRGWDHYCKACAETIITRDLEKLSKLQAMQP
jgi:hypothetical protein